MWAADETSTGGEKEAQRKPRGVLVPNRDGGADGGEELTPRVFVNQRTERFTYIPVVSLAGGHLSPFVVTWRQNIPPGARRARAIAPGLVSPGCCTLPK